MYILTIEVYTESGYETHRITVKINEIDVVYRLGLLTDAFFITNIQKVSDEHKKMLEVITNNYE